MERKKVTKDIGQLAGRVLVFGGVYSNLQALQKMKAIAESLSIPPEHILCTGDIVGYCAQPAECVEEIISWGIHSIAGNVEIQLREGEEDCGCDFTSGGRCDTFSRQWYPYAAGQMKPKHLEWMHELPDFITFDYEGKKALVVHGSFHGTSDFIFKSTAWSQKSIHFEDSGADLILGGHCGLPFSDSRNEKTWLNAGMIGMPATDGTPSVWYLLLEQDAANNISFQHHSFEYDHATAARLMNEKGLPKSYAQTLSTGIWDNCEILPEEETRAQGRRLVI